MTLSVVMVTYNCADVVEGALQSVSGLWEELLVGDAGSTDGTVELVRKHGGVVIRPMKTKNLGERKQELVEKAKGDWILVLDADERVSPKLFQEIKSIIHSPRRSHALRLRSGLPPSEVINPVAYRIPYQNYVFGRPVYYGGEKYAKVRLFRRGMATISPEPLHEEIRVIGPTSLKLRGVKEIGEIRGKIHHHSYRSPWQLFGKFTRYAWVASGMTSDVTLRKLFLYGPHMFWARFVKEKGYKDGWRGFVLAGAFGYMEVLTYWFLLFLR